MTEELETTETEETEEQVETTEEGEETTEEPTEETTEEKPEEELETLKINGVEKQIKKQVIREIVDTLGVPEDEAKRMLQRESASHERMRTANDITKKIEALFVAMREHPEEVMAELGIDVDGIVEKRMGKKLELLQMSEEDREKRSLIEERDRYKRELEEREILSKQESEAMKVNETRTRITGEILGIMKEEGLPESDELVRIVASKMLEARQMGETLSSKEAVAMVKNSLLSHFDIKKKEEKAPAEVKKYVSGQKIIEKKKKIEDFDRMVNEALEKVADL
jgi:hypothetical protein